MESVSSVRHLRAARSFSCPSRRGFLHHLYGAVLMLLPSTGSGGFFCLPRAANALQSERGDAQLSFCELEYEVASGVCDIRCRPARPGRGSLAGAYRSTSAYRHVDITHKKTLDTTAARLKSIRNMKRGACQKTSSRTDHVRLRPRHALGTYLPT